MNKAQWKSLGQCVYLLEKSRECAYYEPIGAQAHHRQFVEYVRRIMDCIETKSMEKGEVDSHLWALHKTLANRVNEIKELRRWTRPKAS